MGRSCDFCGEERSMVYCRSDSAFLCLSCDRNVHSANSLSSRHSRTLVCERCTSQPALVRCIDENASLCQNCDWSGHGNASAASIHNRQTINCYSGCPSAAELSKIWSFLDDIASASELDGKKDQGLVAETCVSAAKLEKISNSSFSEASQIFDLECKPAVLLASSAMGAPQPTTIFKELLCSPKQCCSLIEEIHSFENDNLYDDFNMADIDLSLQNYEELFGYSQNFSEHLFENGGMASLFPKRTIPDVGTNTQDVKIAKGSASPCANTMQPSNSNPMSVDSMLSAKTDSVLYLARKDNSDITLSLSEMTNDTSKGEEYQDCGVSSMIEIGEPSLCPSVAENSLSSVSRDNAVRRYKEKKLNRKFAKTIRYASRKDRADVRKRVKGRFIKAGERYDYDPMCPTASF